ncbi:MULTISPECIES: beta-galactosidase [Agrobacterium tumefaciens complex]|uniref:beta-galactosidase n=1 Tax=Agrobacterium tumefaciens TaxID=358 RepID=UPI001E53ED8F|nr:beta-galactosidase trimerization domain-containing protein [Agrobacterium tumefaciens]
MGLIDHDDVGRRRFEEAKQFGRDIANIKDKLLGTSVHMDLGIAGADFDNEEAHKTYPIGLPSPQDDATLLHRHCYERGISCGFIHPEDDLSRLKVLYIPHWVMWNQEWTANVEAFIEAGGTLIVGAMTGTRDINNHIISEPAPGGALAKLCGVRVEEFGRITAKDGDGLFQKKGVEDGHYVPPQILPSSSAFRKYTIDIGGRTIEAEHLYELLELDSDVETIATWSNRFSKGRAAATLRKVGKGQVIYLATYLTDDLVDALDDIVLAKAGIKPLIADLPQGVEVVMRTAKDRKLLFVLNTLETEKKLTNLASGKDLLTGSNVSSEHTLEGYGCLVIELG